MAEAEGFELEPFCGRERVTAGDERKPAGEILSTAKDLLKTVAEGEGFEPPVPFRAQRFSRPPVSTAHASLRTCLFMQFTSIPTTTGWCRPCPSGAEGAGGGWPRFARALWAITLRAWQRKNGYRKYVFGTKADKVEGHFLRYMKEYATLSGQDPRRWWLHKCRDTFASWCLRRKIDLRTIQAWLGHASIAMTARHLATLPDPEQHQKIQALAHMLSIVKRNEPASI